MSDGKSTILGAQWSTLSKQQGWNDASQVTFLLAFLSQKGLFEELLRFANTAADESNGGSKLSSLVHAGYAFEKVNAGATPWVWTRSESEGVSGFESREQAVTAAWGHAKGVVSEELGMTISDWATLGEGHEVGLVAATLQAISDFPSPDAT